MECFSVVLNAASRKNAGLGSKSNILQSQAGDTILKQAYADFIGIEQLFHLLKNKQDLPCKKLQGVTKKLY